MVKSFLSTEKVFVVVSHRLIIKDTVYVLDTLETDCPSAINKEKCALSAYCHGGWSLRV